MSQTTDVVYISHGGGPMPLLGDPGHQEMVSQLQNLAATLEKPDAILVVSAHWEEKVATITSGPQPSLIYDYYGFPPESYEIEYPCAGEPVLAQQVYSALQTAGIPVQLDEERGFDHGLFVPLKLMYPQADIPCIQLSLVNNLDAETHLALGEALQKVDYPRLLVVGSGFSFHNMGAFFMRGNPEIDARNQAFETWLEETCGSTELTEAERRERLVNWEAAPSARFCHPREEHLLPLHVCYGLAGKARELSFPARIIGKDSGMFYWQRTV
ncbi:DODA-type extradiol aromatic ring-opening family dioxygenase [Marinospirillum perlucidum]|uniref:DODA-type extradiol aromatic ring-opening family dioxygenase n=1 Tax=Marinospirillum perlucidum TaxID=1982602 RepID=UPI000DF14582|nr:class III extradiol ring-cleavage dioxygenase [Marinospirillum perlucidum]